LQTRLAGQAYCLAPAGAIGSPTAPRYPLRLRRAPSSASAAFTRVGYGCAQVYAQHAPAEAAELRCWAASQLRYVLGGAGRSLVGGAGRDPPQRFHHRAASCPWPSAPCGWPAEASPAPNPHVLAGAMAGSLHLPTDAFSDNRTDFQVRGYGQAMCMPGCTRRAGRTDEQSVCTRMLRAQLHSWRPPLVTDHRIRCCCPGLLSFYFSEIYAIIQTPAARRRQVSEPGVEMNAGFTAALAGLADAAPNWAVCEQRGLGRRPAQPLAAAVPDQAVVLSNAAGVQAGPPACPKNADRGVED